MSFDPFSTKHQNSWQSVMDWFNREVVSIEGEAKHFIDESFKTLRSAEGAFAMLLNFKHIRSREAINSQMMKKFNDILLQYGKEVGERIGVMPYSFYTTTDTLGLICYIFLISPGPSDHQTCFLCCCANNLESTSYYN